MSDRFLNGRKLEVEYFDSCPELVSYVNRNKVESNDIQQITQLSGSNWVLLYWK